MAGRDSPSGHLVPAEERVIRRLQRAAFFVTAVLTLVSAAVLVVLGMTLAIEPRSADTADTTVSDSCSSVADAAAGRREPGPAPTTGVDHVEEDKMPARVVREGC